MRFRNIVLGIFGPLALGATPAKAGTLAEDALVSAEWISTALRSSGYAADFSPGSLSEVDRFIEDNVSQGKPKPGGLLSENFGNRVFALGSYVGETIKRERGGEWVTDDNDPQGEIKIAIRLPDGTVFWPVMRVMKRVSNGSEDSIEAYGAALLGN